MADKKLGEVRTQFVEKVNRAVICAVLDDLLEKRVLNDEEVEEVKEKSVTQEQARTLIDVVRKKGHMASLVTIESLCKRDSFLAEQLGLRAFLEDNHQPSIPAGQLPPLELRSPFSRQLAVPPQHPYYTSPSYLNRWAERHPQTLEEQGSSTGVLDSPSEMAPFQDPEGEGSPVSCCCSGSASEPSPQNIVGDPTLVPPSEDLRLYAELMLRMAKALDIDVDTSDNRPKDRILSRPYSDTPGIVSFPILQGLADLTGRIWQKPSSIQATPRKIENLYRAKEDSCEFLTMHPPASLLITKDTQPRPCRRQHSSPANREGRQLDTLGRKIYSSSALNFRIANYQVMMGSYQLFLWESLSQYLDELPEEVKSQAKLIQSEAMKLSKQEIIAGAHSADVSARSMASAIVLRRHSWLRSSLLTTATRSKVEDLPFEGPTLFSQCTDGLLATRKKKRKKAFRGNDDLNRSSLADLTNRPNCLQPKHLEF